MTLEELNRFDGREGRAAYIAVSGVIYDVSNSLRWKDGNHEGSHQAGQDLTEELKTAPHVRSVVERFPVVGRLEASAPPATEATKGIPLLSIIIIAFVVLLMIVTFMV